MDTKGHTGMMMTLGRGSPMSFMQGKSLMYVVPLVGVDDTIPSIMWGKHFIKVQGHKVTDNILYQDNKWTILLATNG